MAKLPAGFAFLWLDGTLIYRTARKRRWCRGDGARAGQCAHSAECSGEILPGQPYIEYVGEVPAYQTGTPHSMACALSNGFIRKND